MARFVGAELWCCNNGIKCSTNCIVVALEAISKTAIEELEAEVRSSLKWKSNGMENVLMERRAFIENSWTVSFGNFKRSCFLLFRKVLNFGRFKPSHYLRVGLSRYSRFRQSLSLTKTKHVKAGEFWKLKGRLKDRSFRIKSFIKALEVWCKDLTRAFKFQWKKLFRIVLQTMLLSFRAFFKSSD